MKRFNFVLFCFAIGFCLARQTAMSQSPFESGRLIPVYPDALLIKESDPGDDPGCCNFKTGDSFEKVVAFYENSLKLKGLDIPSLTTQHPYLKPQTDEMLKEMPAGMKIRFFVLKVVEFQGRKGAELFEVYTSPKGVEFTLNESQLLPGDRHFISEFNESVSGERKAADPQILIAALPSSGPAGHEKQEIMIENLPGNFTMISTGFRKVIKEAKFSEFGDDLGITSEVWIEIEEAEKEFFTDMIKPSAANEKSVMVKGKYKGVESIEKTENGLTNATTTFVVRDKYLITVRGTSLADPKMVSQTIDKMNLEALP